MIHAEYTNSLVIRPWGSRRRKEFCTLSPHQADDTHLCLAAQDDLLQWRIISKPGFNFANASMLIGFVLIDWRLYMRFIFSANFVDIIARFLSTSCFSCFSLQPHTLPCSFSSCLEPYGSVLVLGLWRKCRQKKEVAGKGMGGSSECSRDSAGASPGPTDSPFA